MVTFEADNIDWKNFLLPYEQMVNELIVKFENISKSFEYTGEPSPIEHVYGRVKTASSILEKAKRKNIAIRDIKKEVEDIGGIRLICRFVEDIDRIIYIIRSHEDLEVIKELNYVEDKKASGYRSYHIKIKYKLYTMSGPKELICELQIRTLAMNFWATIEHSLRYKYKDNMPESIVERLRSSAEAAFNLDKEMSTIRDEILEVQRYQIVKNELTEQSMEKLDELEGSMEADKINDLRNELHELLAESDLFKLQEFYRRLRITRKIFKLET
ncbi:MAG: GTP pyrophosphokinase family protein [Defluviitaleaceae bacterium]|nr:GTP pyrophosphokinase family protein [Defluviitaleaceae bacterium]